MAMAAPPANDKKRVKVYELRNNDWFDRGTGFCTGQIINVRIRRCWGVYNVLVGNLFGLGAQGHNRLRKWS